MNFRVPFSCASIFAVFVGCSPADENGDTGTGDTTTTGGNGATAGGETTGGTGGYIATGGQSDTGGADTGGTAAGGTASGGGTSTGGSTNVDSCTPNPSGGFGVDGDMVVDAVTCLTWMKGSLTTEEIQDAVDDAYPKGTFNDAVAACEELSLGGYDDWRVPSLGEIATTATTCLQWSEPSIPWAPEFDETEAVWTSTPAGEKYCVLDAPAGGTPSSSYSSGPGVRCVRGAGTATEISECAASAIPSCN